MSIAEIEKHRIYLEGHIEEWIKFFFPKYAKYPFATFHHRALTRLISNPEWFEVLSWSRELAKSTIVMFVVFYLVLTKQKHTVMLGAATQKAAARLLAPYRANLESNRRIRQYYGDQMFVGQWTELEFKTKAGALFIGLGSGDAPRGARNEAIRPDLLLMDDYDTDEECLNPDVLDKKWDWWEHALYPTRAISEGTLIIFCGNINAKDCCIVRAGKMADHWDVVNIRDDEGRSSWPEKNTEEMIDRVLSKISVKAQQGEYFNNPVVEGKIFTQIKWGKLPPLNKFRFLAVYGDPTQSEQKGIAKNKKGSRKAIWLCGKIARTLYIFKGFIFKGSNADFINDYFLLNQYVGGKLPVYNYIENNTLQDPFYKQVFRPLLAECCQQRGHTLSIIPDEGKKADKAVRIEADLEPLNREGNIVFNEAERSDPHMIELVNEFQLFTLAMSYPADGVDAIHGANHMLNRKLEELQPPTIISATALRRFNKNRY
ncbi:MAG: hypothetical protein RR410_04790 [Alistipes sp.]